jgi:hypothetical protein
VIAYYGDGTRWPMPSPLRTALTNRMSVLTLLLAFGGGMFAAWWLLPIGLIIWIIVVMAAINASPQS